MGRFEPVDSCWICWALLWKKEYICHRCRQLIQGFDLIVREKAGLETLSLLPYAGAVRGLVSLMKEGRAPGLSQALGKILVSKFVLFCPLSVTAVIPMPPKTPGHQDHAFALASCVAEAFGAPLKSDCLERLPSEEAQKTKSVATRAVRRLRVTKAKGDLTGDGICLLVDDVTTTGETLFQAWRELGKPPALGLTLASTPRQKGLGV